MQSSRRLEIVRDIVFIAAVVALTSCTAHTTTPATTRPALVPVFSQPVSSPPATTVSIERYKQAILAVAQAVDHSFRTELARNAARAAADQLDEAALVAAAVADGIQAPNGATVYNPATLPGKVQFNSDRAIVCLTLATREQVPGAIAEGPCA